MKLSSAAEHLLNTLNNSGYRAWLVGGCVRDSLLGMSPHDFDIATTALPQQVMSCFPDFQVLPTGMRHGTVTVVADRAMLEVTTLRSDGCYGDGRRPDGVTFVTDIKADLARRDFTVNAMAWNSLDGLIDPFGGQEDLARKLLRCVGDPVMRLREDSLRIMRCLRFASCLGFDIDPHTAEALYDERDGLARVAAERLNHELSLLICGEAAGKVISEHENILKVIIPEIIPNIDQNLLSSSGNDCTVRLTLLLGGEKPDAVLRRLKFDTDTIRSVSALSALLHRPLPNSRDEAADMTATAGRARMEYLICIWRAKAVYGQPDDSQSLTAAADYVQQVLECGCCCVADLVIDGNTLIDMGMLPGIELGRLLVQLARAVMTGDCTNEPRALTDFARQLYRRAKL